MKQLRSNQVIVAIAMMLAGWLPSLAYDFEANGFYFNITGDQEVEVTYKRSSPYTGKVVIPSLVYYNGTTYSVTSIGKSAFSDCESLKSIEIPNSVTSIGNYAFDGCESLKSIEIPNSVTSIGNYAFDFCIKLTSIEIPNSVTSIGEGPFSSCTSLTRIIVDESNPKYDSRDGCNSIIETTSNTLIAGCKNTIIPNSVTSIGYRAFNDCESLTSIKIPNSVTSIGDMAFYFCFGLTSIVIPNSVTSIGDMAFYGCYGLTSIEIPNSVTSIGDSTFEGCTSLTSIEIPNSVTSIGDMAFYGCSSLKIIEIPNSVTSIGNYAFNRCESIFSIYCFATTPPTIESDTFSEYSAWLYVPIGCISAYQSAIYWKNFNIIIDILDNTITLNDNDVMVATIGDNIVVKNATAGSVVRVYAVDGAMIASEVATEGDVIIEAPAKGIYIVAIDGKSFKVMVK